MYVHVARMIEFHTVSKQKGNTIKMFQKLTFVWKRLYLNTVSETDVFIMTSLYE